MTTREQIVEAMARAICAAESSPAEHWIAFRVTASDALDAALPHFVNVAETALVGRYRDGPSVGVARRYIADAIRALGKQT